MIAALQYLYIAEFNLLSSDTALNFSLLSLLLIYSISATFDPTPCTMLCSDFFHFTHIHHRSYPRYAHFGQFPGLSPCALYPAGVHAIHHRNSSAAAVIHQIVRCATVARIHEMIAVQFQSLHRRPANGTEADFGVSRHGKRGQSKPCPYCEITKQRL